MAFCDLLDGCFFFNKQEKDMPHTTDYLRGLYCLGDRHEECVLHKIAGAYGKNKVPKYLYPNDMSEAVNFNLLEHRGGSNMFLKVIYSDGTSGVERSTAIGKLTKSGTIAAFLCGEGWIELRRKQIKTAYSGPERRHSAFAGM